MKHPLAEDLREGALFTQVKQIRKESLKEIQAGTD